MPGCHAASQSPCLSCDVDVARRFRFAFSYGKNRGREKLKPLRGAELIKLPVLLKRRPPPVSYRRTEDERRSKCVRRVRQTRGPHGRSLLAAAAHREENIGHHINECHVRSFVPSLVRSPPEKITHFYDHPKEKRERAKKRRMSRMVSLVRVVCWNGRTIEPTNQRMNAQTRWAFSRCIAHIHVQGYERG